MATFRGTTRADQILLDFLSAGVTTDPEGLDGTADDTGNFIFGGVGADVIETGEGGSEAHGGKGDDRITGGNSGLDRLYGDAGSDIIRAGDSAPGPVVGGISEDPTHGGEGRRLYGLVFDPAELVDGGTGADQMRGGEGRHLYVVDSYLDTVRDSGSPEAADGVPDAIVATLNYTLPENGTVEDLFLADGLYAPASPYAIFAVGNSGRNTITGNQYLNVLSGKGGSDLLSGAAGSDILSGGAAGDTLAGGDGDDVLRGQAGKDALWGEKGADKLIGGMGNDVFTYDVASEIDPRRPDTIIAGDGGAAFDGPGAASGDLIELPRGLDLIGGDAIVPFDFDDYVFGGNGKGHISVVDRADQSLVRVNLDDDADFEIRILIADGATKARAYTADDFIDSLISF